MEGLETYCRGFRWSSGTLLWFAQPETLPVEGRIFLQENKRRLLALDEWAVDSLQRCRVGRERVQNPFHTFEPPIGAP